MASSTSIYYTTILVTYINFGKPIHYYMNIVIIRLPLIFIKLSESLKILFFFKDRKKSVSICKFCRSVHFSVIVENHPLLSPKQPSINAILTVDCHRRMQVTCTKEGSVLFNDALNTYYLQLYGVRHMVKVHSDSKRGNPLPPHRLLFPIAAGLFYMHRPTDRIAHTTALVTPVVEHWLEQKIVQWVHHKGLIRRPRRYISLPDLYQLVCGSHIVIGVLIFK